MIKYSVTGNMEKHQKRTLVKQKRPQGVDKIPYFFSF